VIGRRARWLTGLAALSLVLASLPETGGPLARGRILRERSFSHFFMGQTEAEQRLKEQIRRLDEQDRTGHPRR